MGLEVPRDAKAQQAVDKVQPLFKALTFAQKQYQHALQHHSQAIIAKDYLRQRDISDEMIDLYVWAMLLQPENCWQKVPALNNSGLYRT